mgnify:CR=1 FL=1
MRSPAYTRRQDQESQICFHTANLDNVLAPGAFRTNHFHFPRMKMDGNERREKTAGLGDHAMGDHAKRGMLTAK